MSTSSYAHWHLSKLVLVFPFQFPFGGRRVFDFDFDGLKAGAVERLDLRAEEESELEKTVLGRGEAARRQTYRQRHKEGEDGDEMNVKWRRTFEWCFLGVLSA
jgi:hypothetical protein